MTYTIGIIGGTGREGKGLAYRWAKAGHRVLIGSRTEEKALAAAADLAALLPQEARVEGMPNAAAVEQCDIAVLTVPFAAHAETLQTLKDLLQGKILIDVTVPLNLRKLRGFPSHRKVPLPNKLRKSWGKVFRLWRPFKTSPMIIS